MSEDYWVSFWKERGRESVGMDAQTRVFRTSNKQPISEGCWQQTLAYRRDRFPVGDGDVVLDLCAGNGLFSREFADRGAQVLAVDISEDLLAELDGVGHPRIRTQCRDMRQVQFPEGTFTHIFLYAGIQYVTHAEAVLLVRSCARWLKPGGLLMIGDVPDAARIWQFYNTPERRDFYFENLQHGRDVIGTWFERDWLRHLAGSAGFVSADIGDQPADQIYAHFRFDAVLKK